MKTEFPVTLSEDRINLEGNDSAEDSNATNAAEVAGAERRGIKLVLLLQLQGETAIRGGGEANREWCECHNLIEVSGA